MPVVSALVGTATLMPVTTRGRGDGYPIDWNILNGPQAESGHSRTVDKRSTRWPTREKLEDNEGERFTGIPRDSWRDNRRASL